MLCVGSGDSVRCVCADRLTVRLRVSCGLVVLCCVLSRGFCSVWAERLYYVQIAHVGASGSAVAVGMQLVSRCNMVELRTIVSPHHGACVCVHLLFTLHPCPASIGYSVLAVHTFCLVLGGLFRLHV